MSQGWSVWRATALMLVVLIGVAGGAIAFRSVHDAQPVLIEFLLPRDYFGWLVLSWNCEGGGSLDDTRFSSRRFALMFPETGALCLMDGIPTDGYVVLGYRRFAKEDGLDDDYERVSSLFLRTGPTRVMPDVAGDSTIQPAFVGDARHRYDIAWVESRPELLADETLWYPRDPARLGNRCDLDRFMQRQFAEPATTMMCGPIPTRQDAGLAG